ncbi:MAG: hypothetical protein ACJ74J_21065 [Blastocatellia bacterium]
MLRKAGLTFFSALVLVALFTVCNAQEDHQHAHGAGEKIGHVHFPISCDSAQAEFDRAVAMLHSRLVTICNLADSSRSELKEARMFLQSQPSRGR